MDPTPERGSLTAPAPGGTGVVERSDAVTGWRYWQLTPSGLLRSVTQRRVDWRPGRPLRAGCYGGGHPAPHEGCECGIYGARDLDTLREHGLCLTPEALVVGNVSLWGRVLPDVSGWRAEFGYPARLLLVRELVGDEELDPALGRLGDYGVPTGTIGLDDSVAGVSAATLAFQAMSARASRTHAD